MLCDILDSISKFFLDLTKTIGLDVLFFIALAVEAVLVIFFLVKSSFSYEARLNRALEKLNYWLFEKKNVTENNIKEINHLFKTKTPKRMCYYWQQYVLFREGAPSSYLSENNLIEKPLKTSSYASNIKNLSLFSGIWAFVCAMFVMVAVCFSDYLLGQAVVEAIVVPIFVLLIGTIFVTYLRARKNSLLNSLYQNTQLFGRFMDNACQDLPSYIDYQILFTPQEIESGQPVLREFLDYKARLEKEEFNRAREESINTQDYDFSATGVDGSIVLDRAMRESELYLKKKEKALLKISQLEGELDTRKKNFDSVQKDYQTKIQASKENVDRLRQMQEETTNRIESNYYRKQQTQEIGKQEQFEQEFEQQRTKYLLEKQECEEEIKKLNAQLDADRVEVENAMMSEYQTFFNKFCKSAEKVVAKVFDEKISSLKNENESDKEYITQLEIKLKNKPEGEGEQGQYDENGNYVYQDGTFYDKDGNFHDLDGNVYSQDGKLISKAEPKEEPKKVVDFDDFDPFEFLTDTAQKGDVYGVAENVVKDVDDGFEIVNNNEKNNPLTDKTENATEIEEKKEEVGKEQISNQEEMADAQLEPMELSQIDESVSESSANKSGRPKKEQKVEDSPARKVGRPRKIVAEKTTEPHKRGVGRPKKVTAEPAQPKKSVGRPRKIVEQLAVQAEKRGRGRPRKNTIDEINKKLSEEEKRINELRSSLNKDLESAMNGMSSSVVDDKKTRRDELIKEIDRLQNEAQQVIAKNESEDKIAEINKQLETLLAEVKKMN